MKALVISGNSFSNISNNGKTLESFFGSFGKDNLAQLFFHPDHPDFDFCDNYFHITDMDVLKKTFGLIRRCGGTVSRVSDSIKISEGLDTVVFNKARNKAKNLALFRDALWSLRAWNTKELRNWCMNFAPDVIFFMGGGAGFPQSIARYLSDLLNVPLVTYFTDDYLLFPLCSNLLDKVQRYRMRRFYRKTVEQSSLLFAIGESMAAEYSAYFGRQFYPLMNSVPIQAYSAPISGKQVVISYFGGLHLNRWQMLVRLANLIDNKENIAFRVYTVTKPSDEIIDAFHTVGIDFRGGVTGQDLYDAITRSDILLHVESDDPFNRALTRLSVSTKIPEYLMSGRVVLGYGPTEVASMKLLSDHHIGVVIASDWSDSAVRMTLNKLLTDTVYRNELGLSGYKYAVSTFNNSQIVEKFTSMMESLISK